MFENIQSPSIGHFQIGSFPDNEFIRDNSLAYMKVNDTVCAVRTLCSVQQVGDNVLFNLVNVVSRVVCYVAHVAAVVYAQ